MLFHNAWQPVEQKYYAMRRMFIKTSGAASGSAYAWVEQVQDPAGTFIDDPNGLTGATTDIPAYMADGSTTVASGTICEAVVHYGGWLIAWPILSATGDITSINGETGPAITLQSSGGTVAFSVPSANTINLEVANPGIDTINGDGTAAQVFSVGTSGTDFAITDTGAGTLRWDLPDANGTANRGAVTIANQRLGGTGTVKYFANVLADLGNNGIGGSIGIFGQGTLDQGTPANNDLFTWHITTPKASLSGGPANGKQVWECYYYKTGTGGLLGGFIEDGRVFATTSFSFYDVGGATIYDGATGTDRTGNIVKGGIITTIGSTTLTVANGGTGATTLTAHGILLGEGTSAITATAAMTDGQLLVGQSSGDPLPRSTSGDATVDKLGAITIANSAVTYAKMQDASAASVLLGRGAGSGAGVFQEITLGTGLSMSGTTLNGSTGYLGDDEWYSGTGTPTGHNDGDWFYATDTGKVWRKISGLWTVIYYWVVVDGATDGYIATYVGGDGAIELLPPSSVGLPGDVILTSAVAISSTSMANVTGMSFSVAANTNYIVDIVLHIASGVHFDFQLTGPSSPSGVLMTVDQDNQNPQAVTAFSTPTAFAGSPLSAFVVYIRASIRNGANAGTVQLQAALTSGSSSQNINANSFMSVRKSL